jgi:curli biogenesis system outer membrane secretion channel CsgG
MPRFRKKGETGCKKMIHGVRCSIGLKAVICVFFLGCLSVQAEIPQGASVAVWDLEYLSLEPEAHQNISEILSAKVIEAFKESGCCEVVEREQLDLALEELNIGSSSIADETTRLQIGRIVGAKYMVFGTYFVLGDKMRIDLRLVEVETGRVVKTAQKTTNTSDPIEWINLAEKASRDLF